MSTASVVIINWTFSWSDPPLMFTQIMHRALNASLRSVHDLVFTPIQASRVYVLGLVLDSASTCWCTFVHQLSSLERRCKGMAHLLLSWVGATDLCCLGTITGLKSEWVCGLFHSALQPISHYTHLPPIWPVRSCWADLFLLSFLCLPPPPKKSESCISNTWKNKTFLSHFYSLIVLDMLLKSSQSSLCNSTSQEKVHSFIPFVISYVLLWSSFPV